MCIGDGVGGADCVETDGSKLYRKPSELENYWMTSEDDEAAFSTWCYAAPKDVVWDQMQAIKRQTQK